MVSKNESGNEISPYTSLAIAAFEAATRAQFRAERKEEALSRAVAKVPSEDIQFYARETTKMQERLESIYYDIYGELRNRGI